MTKSTNPQTRPGTLALVLAISAAAITAAIATIAGCGGGNNNPGGGDRFTTFTLTTGVKPENGGTLSRDPHATSYQSGTAVTLTANPAAGYRFAGWSDTSLHQVTPLTIAMTRNISITANFVPISTPEGHTLTIKRYPDDGGTVRRSPDLTHYPAGTTVTVTAEPKSNHSFDYWSGALVSTATTIEITMDGDKELNAYFLPNLYTLTTGATSGGTVTRDPDQEKYAHNARVTVTAHPDGGYWFARWTGASVLSNNPVTITMDNNKELNAIFELIGDNNFTLQIGELTGGTVKREPEADAYPLGAKVVVTATPAAGYEFVSWTSGLSSTKAVDTVTITGNMVLIAQFQRVRTLTINRIPENGGTVTPESGSSHSIVNPVVNIEAIPASGYRFDGWTVTNGMASIASSSSAKTTINLSEDVTITAKFQRTFVLTINRSPADGGTVTPESGLSHDSGAVVGIVATPASGYFFAGWTVTNGTATIANANIASTSIRLSTNTTITANFQPKPTLTLIPSPAEGGTVSRNPDKAFYDVGEMITITATPTSGYFLAGWTVTSGTATIAVDTIIGYLSSSRITVTKLNTNATITANFQQKGIFVDPRDGQSYYTVIIDGKTWMAENLNYSGSGSTGVCYNNSPDSCAKYGRLYDWATVMNLPSSCNSGSCANQVQSKHQGICPTGWHIPSHAEWTALVNYAGGGTAGSRLKSSAGWNASSNPNASSTDKFGFSALPGGFGVTDGTFGGAGYHGYWWSATESGSGSYGRNMNYDGGYVYEYSGSKSLGLSALCLQD